MKDTCSYKSIIENTILFTIDPEEQPAVYAKEKNRVAEALYLYKTAESEDNLNYGLEIMETFHDCIKYFDPEKGSFLHYFNHAFSLRKNKAEAVNLLQNNSGGVHFSESERNASKAIYQYLKTHSEVTPEDLLAELETYAECFDMTAEQLKAAVRTYGNSVAVSGDADLSSDHDQYTLFDRIAAKGDLEEDFIKAEEMKAAIDCCEQAFLLSREKTKKFLSLKITALFAQLDVQAAYFDEIRHRAFFDQNLYAAVTESGRKLTNKEIALWLGVSNANITQIWKRFVEKMQKTGF